LVSRAKLKARIVRGFKRHYNNGKKLTFQEAYILILKDEFCDRVELKNGVAVPILKGENEVPSLSQVNYIYHQANRLSSRRKAT
jgi:hypothetical protein